MYQGSSVMNSLFQGPRQNIKQNIISGPGPGEYWNHSPGLERPLTREEGPFPIQGNIGSLLAQESRNNYESCSNMLPNIGGSPNCTNTFVPDYYTTQNTCGKNCILTYPESYGDKSFGLIENNEGKYEITNSHALHAYRNIRASTENTGPSKVYGCYEWIPKLKETDGNSCMLDQYKEYQQVGDWTKLGENRELVNYTYRV